MPTERNVGGTDRIVRAVLAAVCTVLAVSALRAGRRSLGTVAALAAVGLGFNTVTCFCGLNKALGIDTTGDGE
ncbi:DUF2892 domain-containing protein [Halovenus sp. WSH3]|uniref:DUF2892 domain-containing protein n=1 Tax=Halovenus carboxidivorans TaxID=2692199 RepID=A0A6B0T0L0_9EURY|nr:DUF2892 domain-containing protein [Halovenus carboxidivorans]MXR51728.1 DUF2892 domain-containing protein [Halovenus carboxidivorans]